MSARGKKARSRLKEGGLVLDVIERGFRRHALHKHRGEHEHDGRHDCQDGVSVRGVHVFRRLVVRRHYLYKRKMIETSTSRTHHVHVDQVDQIDHLDPNLQFGGAVQDLYSTDPTQQPCKT